MGLEVPKLIQRLRTTFSEKAAQSQEEAVTEPAENRESLDSPPTGATDVREKLLTRRTGWKLVWDVKKSQIQVTEGDGNTWTETVGELPPNVQEIIAKGGLEKWVQNEISGK